MARITNPTITVEMTHEELVVVKKALRGAKENYYFDSADEMDTAGSLLNDLGD